VIQKPHFNFIQTLFAPGRTHVIKYKSSSNVSTASRYYPRLDSMHYLDELGLLIVNGRLWVASPKEMSKVLERKTTQKNP
jgi:hypothetical protein